MAVVPKMPYPLSAGALRIGWGDGDDGPGRLARALEDEAEAGAAAAAAVAAAAVLGGGGKKARGKGAAAGTVRAAVARALPWGPAVAAHVVATAGVDGGSGLVAGAPRGGVSEKDAAALLHVLRDLDAWFVAVSAIGALPGEGGVPPSGWLTWRPVRNADAGPGTSMASPVDADADSVAAAAYPGAPGPRVEPSFEECDPLPLLGRSGGALRVQFGGRAGNGADSKADDSTAWVFPTFDSALDEFFGRAEGQRAAAARRTRERDALMRLERLREDQSRRARELAAGADAGRERAAALLASADDVEAALQAVNEALAAGTDWDDLERLIRDEAADGNPVASLIASLELRENRVTLRLPDPAWAEGADAEAEGDPDNVDANAPRPRTILVPCDLALTAHGNASIQHAQRKQKEAKAARTLQAERERGAALEAKAVAQLEAVRRDAKESLTPARKPFWFEKFHWFISSENFLVVSGRDAQQNEQLVKRYLRKGDAYVHADLGGSPTTIVRNPRGTDADIAEFPVTLAQAGTACVCRSAAWEHKTVVGAWWVRSDQVSKTAPTGECEYLSGGRGPAQAQGPCVRAAAWFRHRHALAPAERPRPRCRRDAVATALTARASTAHPPASPFPLTLAVLPTGSFMVRGRKNFLAPAPLELGLGLLFGLADESIAGHLGERAPRSMAGPSAGTSAGGGEFYVRPCKPNVINAAVTEDDEDIARSASALEQPTAPAEVVEGEEELASLGALLLGDDSDGGGDAAPVLADAVEMPDGGDAAPVPAPKAPHAPREDGGRKYLSKAARRRLKKAGGGDGKGVEGDDADEQAEAIDAGNGVGGNNDDVPPPSAPATATISSPAALAAAFGLAPKAGGGGKGAAVEGKPPCPGPIIKGGGNRKYEWQDNEDRALAMAILGSEGKSKDRAARKKERIERMRARKEERAAREGGRATRATEGETTAAAEAAGLRTGAEDSHWVAQRKAKGEWDGNRDAPGGDPGGAPKDRAAMRRERKEREKRDAAETARLLEEEGVLELTAEERGALDLLDGLTGQPRQGDVLTWVIPVCAPYGALSNYKFRVKVTPGALKKGKAVRQAVELFLGSSSSGGPSATGTAARERELTKSLGDTELISVMPGAAKLSMPGMQKVQRQIKKNKRDAGRARLLEEDWGRARGGEEVEG